MNHKGREKVYSHEYPHRHMTPRSDSDSNISTSTSRLRRIRLNFLNSCSRHVYRPQAGRPLPGGGITCLTHDVMSLYLLSLPIPSAHSSPSHQGMRACNIPAPLSKSRH
ncbi:uncharacterized protein V6R79_017687 [Siganus canaliculatus]